MSHKHNLSLAALFGLGIIVIAVFGASVMKKLSQSPANKNPYEGITRPQLYTESPYEGETSASLILFEFGDFACPACGEMQPIVERIFAKYGDRVLHVWKDFPLHPGISEPPAIAARCANAQGKFWQYHDWLFVGQKNISSLDFKSGARELGLDEKKFDECLKDKETGQLVERDLLEAQALGVETAPLFVIGGRAFAGLASFEDFESVVLAELGKVK